VKEKLKKLTKKQKIVICIAAVVLLAGVALAITLPLLLDSNSGIPQPYVDNFDQAKDMYITVSWEKVNGASGYSLQYVFGNVTNEDNIVTVKTDGLFHRIERQVGVLSYRVKRLSNNRDGEYSKWQYLNVEPLKLATTNNVTLNTKGVLSWANVKYEDRGVLKTVPTYHVDLKFEGEPFDTTSYTKNITTTNALEDSVKNYLLHLMSLYDEDTDIWKDITLTVRIKCLNYYSQGGIETYKGYEFLYKAYSESEYYEEVITIDENLFKSIKG
jgi:hypothetical protein